MAIRSDARLGGSIPQMHRIPQGPGIKPLFHSQRDIALILDKTCKPGYGVIMGGTVMSVCSITGLLFPYPQADAQLNDTNAKSYLVQEPSDSDNVLYIGIEDSYKLQVGDELILDGSGTGTKEVQSMAEATLAESDVYELTYGGVTLVATAADASPTTAELVIALTTGDNAANYAAMPFLLTAGSSAVTITWKLPGAVATLCTAEKSTGSGTPTVTQTTEGIDIDGTGVTAENLGAIISIDRTAVNNTQAGITVTTGVSTAANFTAQYFGNVYVKSADEDSTPFAKAKLIIDADVDTGTGVWALGALTSVVVSNAVLYASTLIGLDDAAKTDMGIIEDGRFIILK